MEEEGLPGLPQLVQQAGQLRLYVTRLLSQELGYSDSGEDQRPALLLEELYLQVAALRGDLDRLSFLYEANTRTAPQRAALATARQAVDRLAYSVIAHPKVRAELLGQGGEPHEAARLWESASQAVTALDRD